MGFRNVKSGASCKSADLQSPFAVAAFIAKSDISERGRRHETRRTVLEGRSYIDGDVGVHLIYKRDFYSNKLQRLTRQTSSWCCEKDQYSLVPVSKHWSTQS